MNSTARLLFSIGLIAWLAGCAIVDPNRIISRTNILPPTSSEPVPSPDANWRMTALNFVWNTVNERYYDPKLNGVDWKAVRAQYEPRLMAAKNDDDYWELLDKMTGELKDSHTRVHSPKLVQQQRNNESHGLGLGFLEMEGALVITSVNPQSDAFWAGARAGMVIKTIDDEPAITLYRRLVQESRDTSTPWARTRGAARKINSGDIGTSISMTFIRSDGSEFAATMKRRRFTGAPDYAARVLPSGFGYVRFSGFSSNMQEGIIREIDQMKDTPGMIVDLRNNGGGSGGMAASLLARFFKDDQKGLTASTRDGKPIKVFFVPVIQLEPTLKGLGERAYSKPVVILTNENSASASEIFSIVMKESGRATVIGQRTCGCLLAYMGLTDVPGGAQMAYSEVSYRTKSGARVEGEGVAPNIEVAISRDDVLLNRDRVLERAIMHLTELQKAESAKPVKTQ
jgi:carboxyl-terminal processing protease